MRTLQNGATKPGLQHENDTVVIGEKRTEEATQIRFSIRNPDLP